MFIFLFFNVLVCTGYLILIIWVTLQWNNLKETFLTEEHQPKHQFSIIIPFRNEKDSLEKCVQSLLALNPNGPIYEIIAINDHSTDGSEKTLSEYTILVINAVNSGKKNAITEGVALAKNPWIITVDADCTFHRDWLKSIDQSLIDTQANVLVGAVKIQEETTLLSRFQFMDFASTMGINAAGIKSKMFYLCNGANFVYQKDLFYTVNGYEGNSKVASGDDVFLINKFAELPNIIISFLKSDIGTAITKSESSFKNLYLQRKRWATKTESYANSTIIALQMLIFSIALVILLDFTLFPFLFGLPSILIGGFVLLIKLLIDYFFIKKMVTFFSGNKIMHSFFASSVLYIFYFLFMGITALFPSSVEWKNRKI